ncbi:uncharacterized protein Gasu_01280 [Galdieria sulphuraria]|uniref:GIY-YIG domain-containing protein n=1 Tax=Galdieria sulphuraria TaxID=130081 RepID=M2X877_GALSU|nr:uncharacterized protein Gasu_01280 [Galdieria sulphuraria]EME32765.1 hypothetical protein Gasu_01280 [Galdieria sulphuraria]|eukprot:XP_005709285.1 hypothetical protein Gasu_01280 [Galdieria sulphuraria]
MKESLFRRKKKAIFGARLYLPISRCNFCWILQQPVLSFSMKSSWKVLGYCCTFSLYSNLTTTRIRYRPIPLWKHYFRFSTQACVSSSTYTNNSNSRNNSSNSCLKLDSFPFHPYLDDRGFLSYQDSWGKVSVYAIYDAQYRLQYIGISRDTRTSLLLHLIRMPQFCYYFKFQSFEKPSRTILNQLRETWIKEMNHQTPVGNVDAFWQARWEGPIDVRNHGWLTTEEKQLLEETEENNMAKVLKQICRRVQKEVENQLAERNVQETIRFDPKLKERGLLDGQSKKVDVPDTI